MLHVRVYGARLFQALYILVLVPNAETDWFNVNNIYMMDPVNVPSPSPIFSLAPYQVFLRYEYGTARNERIREALDFLSSSLVMILTVFRDHR